MFARRVRVQLKQLEVFSASLKKRKQYEHHSAEQKDPSNDLSRDQFGLHKIIVAVTESGKLFGLDTTSMFHPTLFAYFECALIDP